MKLLLVFQACEDRSGIHPKNRALVAALRARVECKVILITSESFVLNNQTLADAIIVTKKIGKVEAANLTAWYSSEADRLRQICAPFVTTFAPELIHCFSLSAFLPFRNEPNTLLSVDQSLLSMGPILPSGVPREVLELEKNSILAASALVVPTTTVRDSLWDRVSRECSPIVIVPYPDKQPEHRQPKAPQVISFVGSPDSHLTGYSDFVTACGLFTDEQRLAQGLDFRAYLSQESKLPAPAHLAVIRLEDETRADAFRQTDLLVLPYRADQVCWEAREGLLAGCSVLTGSDALGVFQALQDSLRNSAAPQRPNLTQVPAMVEEHLAVYQNLIAGRGPNLAAAHGRRTWTALESIHVLAEYRGFWTLPFSPNLASGATLVVHPELAGNVGSARNSAVTTWRQGAEWLPYPNDSFATTIGFRTLEFSSDPPLAVRELARVTAGTLYLGFRLGRRDLGQSIVANNPDEVLSFLHRELPGYRFTQVDWVGDHYVVAAVSGTGST